MQISQIKRITIFFLLLLGGISAFSQNKLKQKLIDKDNHRYVVSYGKEYLVNNIITVKYIDIVILEQNYEVIRHNGLHYADILVTPSVTTNNFVAILEHDNNVISVDFNGEGSYNSLTPNDPYFGDQWYLPEIHVTDAWELTTGNPNVKIGVLDSGTDWMHDDLGLGSDSYENIYCNPNENDWLDINNPLSGNHLDDDVNGFVDDYKGWNFDTRNNDSRTSNYHGSFVAGIIAAKANNNYGIAGIAGGWGSQGVSIIPYCVGISNPNSEVIDDAIIAAVDNGVNVIQLSLSVPETSAINDAIQYAINNGVVVVCASGNSNLSYLPFPASNPNVIAVGATTRLRQRAEFSNYGSNLSVVAPGVNIKGLNLTSQRNKFYESKGTSFAAPQVSAVIGLMLSVNPHLTTADIRYIIESTAQKLAGYSFVYNPVQHPNGTWNSEVGYGLVDAYAAVMAAKDIYIQNKTYATGTITQELFENIFAGYSVTEAIPYGNVLVKPYSEVTYTATNSIHLRPGFHVEKKGSFRASVSPLGLDDMLTIFSPRRILADSSDFVSDHSFDHDGLYEKSTSISIVPNPVIDICKISCSKEILSVKIYTMDGQCLLQTNNINIDTSTLSSGIYIVRVTTIEGKQLQTKMIVV